MQRLPIILIISNWIIFDINVLIQKWFFLDAGVKLICQQFCPGVPRYPNIPDTLHISHTFTLGKSYCDSCSDPDYRAMQNTGNLLKCNHSRLPLIIIFFPCNNAQYVNWMQKMIKTPYRTPRQNKGLSRMMGKAELSSICSAIRFLWRMKS